MPAVKDLGRGLSYGELLEEVSRVAAALSENGVHAGDRVALLLSNSVDFVVAALSCLWLRAAFVPLSVADPDARLTAILRDCAPTFVVTSSEANVEVALPDLAAVRHASIPELRECVRGTPEPHESKSSVAYVIYTSGTTGTPKGVLISNGAFVRAVATTSLLLGLDRTTRTLCVSPFHFDGSFGTLFTTLFAGGSVVIRPRDALLFVRTFFRAIAEERITYSGFSPSYLRLLLASPQITELGSSSLSVIALGGEASSAADIEQLWSHAPDLQVFNRYGPTETTIAVTHLRVTPAMVKSKIIPIGAPHPGVTFYLVDGDGDGTLVQEIDHVGELYVGGVQLMDGYLGAPELSDEVLRRDVVEGEVLYRTGDLAYRRVDGNYVYVDRTDRVVKRSGVRISLIEVGEALRSLDGVAAAVAVAYDDGDAVGIVAFVVAGSATTRELDQRARALLPATMMPDRIELVSALPLTKSGKLDERELLHGAGLSPLRPTLPRTTN